MSDPLYLNEETLQRFINPREIGDIVTFVCSDRAAVINGSSLRAEGGLIGSAF
ncbi:MULTISPECIES: hypothetical protein [unclassified Lentimonas]|uniref:hypothetical protein n=1 Tax=unclassified Lentimonas TaxID=2630993 RepID=UPI00132716F9|nr:Unannotated [Lentimonas sp. CC4]CAA6687006.1 Unannotated [Lentimonas sp. CC6]CAA6696750.1 Unannotated [Lentimonas sp. CC10]CAA6697299.1 Unannotated [Lentimonas sp. CC19]CAA7072271.1 Unannotated [Lentimonas sp. CC11]CAA7172025.1 Unannotated [Lentimonas sp. CC21]CAA7182912.1 Unannotated [Lentimonas sp. CC8]